MVRKFNDFGRNRKKTPLVKVYPYPRIFLFAVSC